MNTPRLIPVLAAKVLCLTVIAVLSGCALPPPKAEPPRDVISINYLAADALDGNLLRPIPRDTPLLVASFVNIDNLDESSTLGRMVAEQIGSRLNQRGYKTVELKLRQRSIYIQEGKGEFLLSRDVKELSLEHNAPAVVVGTYALSANRAYITAKIVRTDDSAVLATTDYALWLTPEEKAALTGGAKR